LGYTLHMMNAATGSKVIGKGDTVRSRWGEFNGTAWVVCIQSDGTTVVEMTNRARVWTMVDSLIKVDG
jgi:hypothetical protein